jgi:ribosomal protein S12 methylthiotransferase accessory factor
MRDEAIHPNACMLFSDDQYRTRKAWNRESAWTRRVPDPLDTSESIDWSPVWSLTEERRKYLPTAYLYHSPHIQSRPRGDKFCFCDSNGNASGNNLEEAVLHGFLELVERDAVAIWWYNQLLRPLVDLDQLDDLYVRALVGAYQAEGREVWVLDITHDFGVPTYVAVSRVTNGPRDEILTGFGAHLSPRIAISRALTEVNQVLPRCRPGRAGLDAETEAWFSTVSLKTAPFLMGSPADAKPIPSAIGPHTGDLLDDVHYCHSLVERQSMEFLVLDQTRRETGLSSVKVIVPGMRHYWRRLAPGRLYQAPVNLGWLDIPNQEGALNPNSLG